ncbi:serine hydrolase [Clostridium sp. ZS2-4]|uniref:serine hydrolase n=1 Tax=Clostridium sp. ZS2-4 TaxID=2987703 RepID=UPI00227D5483|nr:serine hydrolase [Clostridium sp. ZS2-4]MCY6354212.1 serine hydrolase [Clostridium sp. ZS2-4]
MIKRVFSSILMSIFLTCSNVTATLSANDFHITKTSTQTQENSVVINVNGKVVKGVKAYMDSNSKLMIQLAPIVKEFDQNADIDLKNRNVTVKINKDNSSTKDRNISEELDKYLSLLQKSDNFHGSVLVSKGDTILLDKGYNMANFEQNIKNTAQTTFPIGSMTKQFTAMAIMQLVEKGMINEQDKLSKYIPDFPNGDDITIYNLLTHTSGLVIFNQLPEFLKKKPEDLTNINNVINLFKDKPLNFKPGTKFEYCNSGYLLLGYIIEKVSNMSYEDYLKTNIFKPLNMNDTGIAYKGNEKMYSSQGYSGYLEVSPVDDELILNGVHGAGALYSTTEDIYKWSRALNTEKLVNKKNMEKIFSKCVKMPIYNSAYYGYGWMINEGKYGHEVFHGGNVLGFTSNIKRYTDKDLTIIILTNAGYYDIDSLTNVLADIYFGSEYKLPKKKKEIKVDSKILNNYVGKYSIDKIVDFNIIREGNHLYYQASGQPKFEVFPEANNKVFFKVVDAEIVFNTDSKGNITGIELYQFGQKFKGTKVK